MRVHLLFFLFFLLLTPVLAHDQTFVFSTVVIDNEEVLLNVTVPYSCLEELWPEQWEDIVPDLERDPLLPYLEERFQMATPVRSCIPVLLDRRQSNSSASLYSYRFDCGPIPSLKVRYDLFFELSGQHHNIADFIMGEMTTQTTFSSSSREVIIPVDFLRFQWETEEPPPLVWHERFLTFFKLGVEHIWTGYDHLLFLLAILLATLTLHYLLVNVTSFTVAHSITLFLASLGAIFIPPPLPEALIALSIAYVGFENLFLKDEAKRRWILIFFFGLIHGLGFSSILREMGVARGELLSAVFSFNVGVEVGQLVFVLLLFPLLCYGRRWNKWSYVVKGLSIIIGIAGLCLFLLRIPRVF